MKNLVLLLLVGACAVPAMADPTFGFVGVSNNSAFNTVVGQSQFSVELVKLGFSQIEFVFSNIGLDASTIANVYWNDSAGMLKAAGINAYSSGVAFEWGAAPPKMQGGADWSSTVAAQAMVPGPFNGINPGESVGFVFDIVSGDFAEILSGVNNDSFNIGLHVIAFADGDSEWFEVGKRLEGIGGKRRDVQLQDTKDIPITPAPGAMLLAGIGTAAVGWLRRQQSL